MSDNPTVGLASFWVSYHLSANFSDANQNNTDCNPSETLEQLYILPVPVVGFVLNAFEMAVFRCSDMRSRSSNVLFVISLCSIASNVMIVFLTSSSVYGCLRGAWRYAEYSNLFADLCSTFLSSIIAFSQCVLAFERAMVIRNPFWLPQNVPYIVPFSLIIIAWLNFAVQYSMNVAKNLCTCEMPCQFGISASVHFLTDVAAGIFILACSAVSVVALYRSKINRRKILNISSNLADNQNPTAVILCLNALFFILVAFPAVGFILNYLELCDVYTYDVTCAFCDVLYALQLCYFCSFDIAVYVVFSKRFRRNLFRMFCGNVVKGNDTPKSSNNHESTALRTVKGHETFEEEIS